MDVEKESEMARAVRAWLEYKRHNQGLSKATIAKYDQYLYRLEQFLAGRGLDHLR